MRQTYVSMQVLFFFVPVSMQIGGLLFIHLRNVLKTHSNDGIVSSRTSATANMVLCR